MNSEQNSKLGKVRCPNICHNGLVKKYPDSNKALYEMIKCEICNGKGYIKESQKARIEAMM